MKSSVRRAVLGLVLVPVLTIATALPADAGPTAPRTVVQDQPSWTSSASVQADTPDAVVENLTGVLNLRDAAGAEALAAAVSDPAGPQYRKYISSADWRSRFAPTDQTVAQVTGWLTSQGFSIGSIPANHRFIPFAGTAAQVRAAFATTLKDFTKDGQQTSAPTTPLSVPTAIAGGIAAIGGVDASATKSPLHLTGAEDVVQGANSKRADSPTAVAPQGISPQDVLPPPAPVFRNSGPCSAFFGQKPATTVPQILKNPLTYAPCGYKPAQLRGAYGTDLTLKAGYDGRGTTVAVVDAYASPTILADTQKYALRNDPQHPFRNYQFKQSLPTNFTFVDECDAAGWYGEETLDVQAVHAMSPAANILYVGASSCQDLDLTAAVNTVVDNELAQVITNSYGSVGEPASVADVEETHQSLLQAAAQGISVMFSSGDSGDEVANTGTRQVDYSASDPFVTAVGGTSLAVGAANAYLFEQGWGTGKSVLTNGAWTPNPPAFLYGGGGGTSRLFRQPAYQKGVVPGSISNFFHNGPHRAVPDVAMVGDPNTGFLIGQSQTFPDGVVRYSEYRIGGTSLSSPLFAGVIAIADQVAGGSLGFLNPKLYKLAGSPAFRDIASQGVTDGVVRVDFANAFDSSNGLITSLRTFNQTGTLRTRKGYDDVTGIGTPNIAGLLGVASGSGTATPGAGPTAPVQGQPQR
jgi:subtilase family serine protease